MTILNIETATSCCSAAITINGQLFATQQMTDSANHAHQLPLFIDNLLRQARQNNLTINAVALSQGPGSYTGLRIGASTAKGICYGLNIPLIPIDTLQLLTLAAVQTIGVDNIPDNSLFIPMIDARRMEVYTASYDPKSLCRTDEITAKVIDEHAFETERQQYAHLYFFGNGATKCKDILATENAHFIDAILPQAQYMGTLAEQPNAPHLDRKQMAYFEPFYLKEFTPAPSHVKGLQ